MARSLASNWKPLIDDACPLNQLRPQRLDTGQVANAAPVVQTDNAEKSRPTLHPGWHDRAARHRGVTDHSLGTLAEGDIEPVYLSLLHKVARRCQESCKLQRPTGNFTGLAVCVHVMEIMYSTTVHGSLPSSTYHYIEATFSVVSPSQLHSSSSDSDLSTYNTVTFGEVYWLS